MSALVDNRRQHKKSPQPDETRKPAFSAQSDPRYGPLRFFFRVLLFGGCVLAMHVLVNFGVFTYRGNRLLGEDHRVLASLQRIDKGDVNAVFVGSSRFKHGVIPQIFDEQCPDQWSIRSMNFGHNALRPLRSFLVAETVLREHSNRLQYLFVECVEIDRYTRNYRTKQFSYWLDLPTLRQVFDILDRSETSATQLRKSKGFYIVSYLWRLKNLQLMEQLASARPLDYPWESTLGYVPASGGTLGGITQGRRNLLDHPHKAQEKLQRARAAHVAPKNRPNGMYEQMQRLIHLGAEKGVHVIFVLPPHVDYTETLSEFHRLKREHRIDLSLEEELYQVHQLHDLGHMNPMGAERYSRRLAEEFRALRLGTRP